MQVVVNGTSHEVSAPATIADLLRELQLNSRGIAVEVNQVIVPRDQHETRSLCENDSLEVVSLTGGG